MSTQAAASPATNIDLHQLKSNLRKTWMSGNYDIFSRYLEHDAFLFFQRLGVQPGERLLDVACGSGQLALIAARAGAKTTGCDIAANWISQARERATLEGLNVTFDEGDAEALPYEDAKFDVVTSILGAMFAPRPDLVASEMARVCRPGGKMAMANWTANGFVGKMFKTISKYIAPSGMPSPILWGDETVVRERFRNKASDIQCRLRFYQLEYPFGPEAVVDFFRDNYGPMTRAFASLSPEGQAQLKDELTALWTENNRAPGNGTLVDAEYLEVIAVRSNPVTEINAMRSHPQRASNQRAQLLADRIEEGAARLAEFARRLNDMEWNTPMIEGGKPGRTIGTVVHHVASIYPIEIAAARAIAAGNAVTQITWEVVNDLNARHAADTTNATRAETLDLLHTNSREAADVVRNLTDAELDRAAPFSLSYGAPVTAQFVLEDHAVRHSWHHLARIRKAVDRTGHNPVSQLK